MELSYKHARQANRLLESQSQALTLIPDPRRTDPRNAICSFVRQDHKSERNLLSFTVAECN